MTISHQEDGCSGNSVIQPHGCRRQWDACRWFKYGGRTHGKDVRHREGMEMRGASGSAKKTFQWCGPKIKDVFVPHQKTFAYSRSNSRSYPYSIPLGLEAIKRQSFFLCQSILCLSLSIGALTNTVYLSEFLPLIPSHTFFRLFSIFLIYVYSMYV